MFTPASAWAQSAEAFYASRPQMKIIISSTTGGGYDLFGRLIARYLPNYLPGTPQLVPQNMPGAGGMTAANYLYNIAPKDGSTIGIIDRGVPTAELLYGKDSNSLFDATKFNWIGSLAKEIGVGMLSTRSSAQTVEDLKTRETILASNGLETDSAMYPRLLNATLGTKFRVIAGYPGQVEYYFSMIKGETDGLFMSGWSGPNRLSALRDHEAGAIRYFVQMSAQRHPDFGDTPTIFELVKSDTDRKIIEILMSRLELGRPILAPPGVAADRINMLRAAFEKMSQNEDMISEAKKSGNQIDPINGASAQDMIVRLYGLPDNLKSRMREIVRIQK
jgi:tripartite-type tricarboxylate transporter receptor subunit TctC